MLAYNENFLLWTISHPTCASTNDTVVLNRVFQPIADAGPGGSNCDLTFDLQATPSVAVENQQTYTGTWTHSGGGGTVNNWGAGDDQPVTTVTVNDYGTYQFTWTESNGSVPCTDDSTITVRFIEQPVINEGSGGTVCGPEFTFSAVYNAEALKWNDYLRLCEIVYIFFNEQLQ